VFDTVWSSLPPAFRDELILQCVKQLRTSPDECDAFARVVADLIKARPQTVKSQWRLADIFGTTRAIARDPRRAAPFFGITYMTARKADLTALYTALGVAHTDLAVARRLAREPALHDRDHRRHGHRSLAGARPRGAGAAPRREGVTPTKGRPCRRGRRKPQILGSSRYQGRSMRL